MKVCICLISTGKYWQFVQPLIDSICKYFLLRHQIEIHLFTDNLEREFTGNDRVQIFKELIPSYKFPEATLFRYAIMTSKKYNCDYIYYLDVDYLIVSEVDEEIFGNLVAILHPGFSCVGGGSWCNNELSTAYTFKEKRKQYFCGGTQGGCYSTYYKAMQEMDNNIKSDEDYGVRSEWNDEGHWNKLLSELPSDAFKILDSSYCFVEQPHLQKLWKIDHLNPKILALAKDHKSIRE